MFCVYNRFGTYEPNMVVFYFRVECLEGEKNFSFRVEAFLKRMLKRLNDDIPDFQETQNLPSPKWLKGFRYILYIYIFFIY